MAFAQIHFVSASGLLIYGVPSFLLIISYLELETLMRGRLANVFKSIGDASYATYLSHAFVVDGTIKVVFEKYNVIDPYAPFGVFFIIATALVAGHIIYRTIDKPLSRLCRRKLSPLAGPAHN
jgi:exopolysaccharide production protein ExoZ